MSDAPEASPHVPLPVLPHSGKVEQLQKDMQHTSPPTSPPTSGHNDEPYEPHQNRISASPAALKSPEILAIERKVVAALKRVYDPEIPVDIYELGLIYDIDIDPDHNVQIRMTLTAPGCPVAGSLPMQVEQFVEAISEVRSSAVELVWDPPWDKEMMSEQAKLQLGML